MLSIAQVKNLGGYVVIYIDPPWLYRDKAPHSAAIDEYDCQTLNWLMRLPVPDIGAKSCIMFIWAVNPMIDQCVDLIRHWGFKFKGKAFEWVKYYCSSYRPFYGRGSYTRATSESCFVAVRGKNPPRANQDQGALVETFDPYGELVERVGRELSQTEYQVLRSIIGEHSAKPKEVRERIKIIMGEQASAIELFARERAAGFDCWGNDPKIGKPDIALTPEDIQKWGIL